MSPEKFDQLPASEPAVAWRDVYGKRDRNTTSAELANDATREQIIGEDAATEGDGASAVPSEEGFADGHRGADQAVVKRGGALCRIAGRVGDCGRERAEINAQNPVLVGCD